MIKKLEAVIFDYDGTIVDTEKEYFEVTNYLLKELLNKELDKMDYIKNVSGTSTSYCRKYLTKKYELTEREYDKLEEKIEELMKERTLNAKVLPYIEETMQLLKENNIKIGVASNGDLEHIVAGLKVTNLYKYVDDIVTKDDVTNAKPAPDIYLLASERLGIQIENCLVIEDSRPGATAAASSGAYLILQTNDITKHFSYDDINYSQKDINLYEFVKKILQNNNAR